VGIRFPGCAFGRAVHFGPLLDNKVVDEGSRSRPLPSPPRCRGIPLDDGQYTGCPYGYGDLPPYTGPRDCPVCKGSGFESPIGTTLPHSDFGDPDCCGCLKVVFRPSRGFMICNECSAIVRTFPVADLEKTLTEMELALDVASELCPACGSVNLFPGFSRMLVFTCHQCGKAVSLPG
jgi:hypothetical protein